MKHYLLLALLSCSLSLPYFVEAQCGVSPTSGLVTETGTGIMVNSYYPGTGNPVQGSFTLTVGALDARGSATPLAAGDLVVIMQMQGADLNTANSTSYGGNTGTGSGALSTNLLAGTYEYNNVSSVAGSVVTFTSRLARSYYTQAFTATTSTRSYQVIRVPRYYNYTINSGASVVAPAWDGNTGGVVVLDAVNTLTLNGSVNVNALGFRGGGGKQFTGAGTNNTSSTSTITTLQNTDYRFYSAASTAANTTGGAKGEGIAGTPRYTYTNGAATTVTGTLEGYIDGSIGRGAPANAGGGATDGIPVGANNNQYNTGGGGGGNAGSGGNGGSGWHGGSGTSATYPFGGRGGSAVAARSLQRVILGGGGGAGSANNSDAVTEVQSSGGPGGGIIIVRAGSYTGTGSLQANGGAAPGVNGVVSTSNTDAAGGGGGGGTIVVVTRATGASFGSITASATGGKGGDMLNHWDHGPGGGGGGGAIYSNGTITATVTGGANGKTRVGSPTGAATNDFGAVPGGNGSVTIMATAPVMYGPYSGSGCGTLPVTLVSFTGLIQDNGVALNWEAADAQRFNRFEIEYSHDGTTFSNAGQVLYTDGKSNYAFLHNNALSSVAFYRLKLVDHDGSYSYSKTITLRLNRSGNNLLVYPNPARQATTVQVKANEAAEASVTIRSASGTQVYQKNVRVAQGDNVLSLDVANYPAGLYVIEIRMKNGQRVKEKLHIVKD